MRVEKTCGVPLLVLLLAGTAMAQSRPVPVVVVKAVRKSVASGQTFAGAVQPLKRAVVGSAVDGRVVDFPIEFGQRVEAGDTLASLLDETIKLEHAAADAELRLRKEELAELEHGSRPEEIEQARARMEAAKASKDYLAKKRARVEELYQKGATSIDLLEEAVSMSLAADETYLDAQAAWELAVAGPRAERIAQATARRDLQQAVVDQLADRIKKHTIITRFAGYVAKEHTEVGSWVSRGDPVAEIIALDEFEVDAYVLDSHVAHVRHGDSVAVTVPALPDRVFTGLVYAVAPQAEEPTRTFPVKVRIPNEITKDGPLVKSGMLARVTLPTGTPTESILVPKDALVLGARSPMVFVVKDGAEGGPVATAVPVEIGVADGELIQVLPSLSAGPLAVGEGDLVVILGNERLRPGQSVVVAEDRSPAADESR